MINGDGDIARTKFRIGFQYLDLSLSQEPTHTELLIGYSLDIACISFGYSLNVD